MGVGGLFPPSHLSPGGRAGVGDQRSLRTEINASTGLPRRDTAAPAGFDTPSFNAESRHSNPCGRFLKGIRGQVTIARASSGYTCNSGLFLPEPFQYVI
jgi:hypothetical protein